MLKSVIFGTLLFFIYLPETCFAQLGIQNQDIIKSRKFKTTFVTFNGIDNPDAEQFRRLFQDYWKITPEIEFINKCDIYGKTDPNALYLNFLVEIDTVRRYVEKNGVTTTKTEYFGYYVLAVSAYKESYFDNEKNANVKNDGTSKKKSNVAKLDRLATIILASDPDSKDFSVANINYKGEFENWQPGYIKNYIQQLNAAFMTPKNTKPKDVYANTEALKVLKNETLYVQQDVNFGKYTYKQAVLSEAELSEKIINSKEPLYYVMFFQYGYSDFLSVVNSQTGEVLYQINIPSNSIGKNYAKRLVRQIEK